MTVPGIHERPHPLLVDWLETDPAAQQQRGRALVVGSGADAAAMGGARTGWVVQVGRASELPTRGEFDLVVICADRAPPPAASLTRAGSLLTADGRLLLISALAGGEVGSVLAPVGAAGLELVSFDDLAEGPARGQRRWLRALWQRPAPETLAIVPTAAEKEALGH
jgi:hypothetical protein